MPCSEHPFFCIIFEVMAGHFVTYCPANIRGKFLIEPFIFLERLSVIKQKNRKSFDKCV